MRESVIQKAVVEYAKSKGWMVRRFVSRGMPDRVFFKGAKTIFIEFKAPGQQPRPDQVIQINNLKKEGFEVHVVDNIETGKALFDLF